MSQDPLCDATAVDRRLRAGESVPFKGFSLEVIHAPGHTAGHCLYHEPASGALLTGDHLMGNAVPYTDNYLLEGAPDPRDPLRRPPRFKGLPLYLAGLRALRRQRFRMLLPAHGGVLERPARAIDDALLFYEVRIQRIERALRACAAPRGWATRLGGLGGALPEGRPGRADAHAHVHGDRRPRPARGAGPRRDALGRRAARSSTARSADARGSRQRARAGGPRGRAARASESGKSGIGGVGAASSATSAATS